MRTAAGVLAATLALLAAGAGAQQIRMVPLDVSPLEIDDGEYSHARLTGAWRLKSPEPEFGGLSALLVENEVVTAVTDRGWWVVARRGGDVLGPQVAMRPMGAAGGALGKREGDAESLARRGDRLAVGFERDHRIVLEGEDGEAFEVRAPGMAEMPDNAGLEALATLPDGRLIAIGEGAGADAFPVFLVDAAGEVRQTTLPRVSGHDVTGADVGPDGRLYLLQRHYSPLAGISIRLLRYHLGDDGLPDARTAETLAAWESASGIDNMEAVDAFRDADGGPVKVWLLSDDNFRAPQRTILVELEVQ